ncbi:MAG: hypothetical protein DSY37_01915 [Hyperthermus sp.]|nr:MAG: hypothetical protein DSY37_01915 [Hyperthermus sp.]
MKVTPSCVACSLSRRSFELELLFGHDNARRSLPVLRDIIEAVNLYIGPDIDAAELATVAFKRAKDVVPLDKLYENLIDKYISLAINRSKKIEESVEKLDVVSSISVLLRAAALASGFRVLSVASILEEPPSDLDMVSPRVGIDDSSKVVELMREAAARGKPLYYVFRGVLEAPYDMALIRKVREEFNIKVIGIAKIERFEDHLTVADLERLGYIEYLDDLIEFSAANATLIGDEAEHIYNMFRGAGLVIFKGALQALHALNHPPQAPLALLFTANCSLVSKVFNIPLKSLNIILRNVREKLRPG